MAGGAKLVNSQSSDTEPALKEISLEALEGPHAGNPETVATFREADDLLAVWILDAPWPFGVHGCKVVIKFTDGEMLELTYGMEQSPRRSPRLADWTRQYCQLYSGQRRPRWWSRSWYDRWLAEETTLAVRERLARFLDQYRWEV